MGNYLSYGIRNRRIPAWVVRKLVIYAVGFVVVAVTLTFLPIWPGPECAMPDLPPTRTSLWNSKYFAFCV